MRVTILGLGGDRRWITSDVRALGGGGEIWAVNDWWTAYPGIHPDRACQLHAHLPDDPLPDQPRRWINWRGMFRYYGSRAIIADPDNRLPVATVVDMQDIEDKFGEAMTTSSIACAMLVAAERFNASAITLAGVPLNVPGGEYQAQGPGILRVRDMLEGRGIEVNWPEAEKIEVLTVNWREVSSNEADVMGYWKTKSPIRLALTPS
jgi:hypothetical protein